MFSSPMNPLAVIDEEFPETCSQLMCLRPLQQDQSQAQPDGRCRFAHTGSAKTSCHYPILEDDECEVGFLENDHGRSGPTAKVRKRRFLSTTPFSSRNPPLLSNRDRPAKWNLQERGLGQESSIAAPVFAVQLGIMG
jgi:hypothetical protein